MADQARYRILDDEQVRFFNDKGKRDKEAEIIYQELVRRAGDKTFRIVQTEVNDESLDEIARGKAADWMENEYQDNGDKKRIGRALVAAGVATGVMLGGVTGAGVAMMVGMGGKALAESLKRSIALKKKYNEIRSDEGNLLNKDGMKALAERALISSDEDLNVNEKVEGVNEERASEIRKAFIQKILDNTHDGENIASNIGDGLQAEAIKDFAEQAKKYQLRDNKRSQEKYKRMQQVLEAYVKKNAVVSEAKMNAGLGLKEVMRSSADENTLRYGIFAGAVLGVGGQVAKMYGKRKITQALGGGNPIKIAAAAVIGGTGAAIKQNRNMKRDNLRAAFRGEDVKGEGAKYEMASVSGAKTGIENCFDGDKIKDGKKEELIQKIADFRARNKLQNEKGVALLAFSGREGIEEEKLEMFELIAKAERGLNDNEKAQLKEKLNESREGLEKKIGETVKNRRKEAIKAGLKGFVTGAVTAAVFTYGMDLLRNVQGGSVARVHAVEGTESGDVEAGDAEVDDSMGSLETESGTNVVGNSVSVTRDVEVEEYMNDENNTEVMSYSRVNYDGSKGVSFGKPELYEYGYRIPVGNAPEGTCFAINVGTSGQVLTAEVHDGYALLPASSAISDTIQDVDGDGIPDFTGDWASVGTMNADGTFTSFQSVRCAEPFDGTFHFIDEVDANGIIVESRAEDLAEIAKEVEITENFETIDLAGGETIELDLVEGGYDQAVDPFWIKPEGTLSAAFGEAITAQTPEEAMEQWVVNIQKSPDQLVWNAVALDGFDDDANVDNFFVKNFGGNWRSDLGIQGAIDTEEEVNIVANALARTYNDDGSSVYGEFKRLFLHELKDRLNGGSVEFRDIASGGRFTNLKQANQFVSSRSDVTGSIVRATSANSGGKGIVLKDGDGENIFSDKITRKLLRVPNGQKVKETIIRMNCGGQMTREKVIILEPEPELEIEDGSDIQPGDNTPDPVPNPKPVPIPPDNPEPEILAKGENANAGSDVYIQEVTEYRDGEQYVEATPENRVDPSVKPGTEVHDGGADIADLPQNDGELKTTFTEDTTDWVEGAGSDIPGENAGEVMQDTADPETMVEVAEGSASEENTNYSNDELSDIYKNIMGQQ